MPLVLAGKGLGRTTDDNLTEPSLSLSLGCFHLTIDPSCSHEHFPPSLARLWLGFRIAGEGMRPGHMVRSAVVHYQLQISI